MTAVDGPLSGPPIHSLLVATDLSRGARRALERAACLPLAPNACIDLLHVLPDSSAPRAAGRARHALVRALAQEAKHLHARLKRRGDVRIEQFAVRGRPFAEILRHAEKRRAELIVVGRHGVSGLGTFLIGSTAERVVRGRVAPVLVVTGEAKRPYRRPLVAVDAVTRFVPIVEDAMRLLPADLPELHVVTAYEIFYEGYVRTRGWSPAEIRKLRAKLGAEARQSLRSQLTKRVPKGTQLRLFVKRGEPRRVIRSLVEQLRPDLVALGTASRRGLARFLLGSVAAEVLRSSEVDVLLVPRAERLERKEGRSAK